MPILTSSTYPGPPFLQFNGHLQTIFPAIFRNVKNVVYERERITLSDGDFIDLDWIDNKSKKLVFLAHGLEGNSERHYIKGMAKAFDSLKYDVLAWNSRSCSGEMNKAMRLYNHGEIGDIHEVIQHALSLKDYEEVILIGFSMGGNIILKYLGVHKNTIPKSIKKAIAFSSPTDLVTSVKLLDEPQSRFYKKRFLKKLKEKIRVKANQFPDVIDFDNFAKIKSWRDFDDFFTVPLNGFKDADDFYFQGSARNFMTGTTIPTLIVNALNDPIITPECSPKELCKDHKYLVLETPSTGGHVGFMTKYSREISWAEHRAIEFIKA